jgi:hypothetical protein
MEFTQLRDTLISNFRVLDTCCTTGCISTANTPSRISALRQVTAKNGVHFVTAGYKHLTSAYVTALKLYSPTRQALQNRTVTSGEVSGVVWVQLVLFRLNILRPRSMAWPVSSSGATLCRGGSTPSDATSSSSYVSFLFIES